MSNQTKLVAAGLLVATFLGGAVVGTAAWAAWRGRQDRRPQPTREQRPSYVDRLAQELGLSQVQQESVRAVLDRREQGMREVWRAVQPRFDSLRQQIREDVLAQLDSTQKDKFHALIARSDSMRTARENRENRDQHDRRR